MCEPFSDNSFTWYEVTKEEIEIAMLFPGEYVKKDNKYYTRRGMLDGYICPCSVNLVNMDPILL